MTLCSEITGLGLKTVSFIPPDDLSPTPNHDNLLVKRITNLLPNHNISIIRTKFRIQSNPGLEHPITIHQFHPLHTHLHYDHEETARLCASSLDITLCFSAPTSFPLHNRNFYSIVSTRNVRSSSISILESPNLALTASQ
jgi:hypothetical protein